MKFILRLWLVVLLCIVSSSAFAKTYEIKSENFVLVGSVRATDGKALLLELEQYRQAVLQLLGVTNPMPETVPVRIYTVRGAKGFELLTGRTDIRGLYTTRIEGPTFILNSKNGFRRGKGVRHIALHEYTHHLLATYSDQIYPRWYHEGLANYFSTFEVNKNGDLIIGQPYQPYAHALSQKTWMPTDVVVNSILSYPFKLNGKSTRGLSASSYFYAQSWLAVHYIMSTKTESPKLDAYIKNLNTKRGSGDAFEQAFGRTPAQFDTILKAYFKANKYATLTIRPKVKIKDHAVHVKELSKGEAEFHKAEAMRVFLRRNGKAEQVVKQYDKAAEMLGETPAILAARADLATWENAYEKAQGYINKAMVHGSGDASILRAAGTVLLSKNDTTDSPDKDELDKARRLFKRAMIKNPNDIAAHYYYVKTYAIVRKNPSKQAIESAWAALDYYRANNFVDSNLGLVGVLLNGGEYKRTEPVIDKAMVWSRNSGARMQALTMKRYIESRP